MTADTGSALAAAIADNPADNGPWLVYADWLDEHGRDAEATAIRTHLPALRDAVLNGHELPLILSVAADCPPTHPMWNLMFGLPVRIDPPVPAPEPAPPAPAPRPVELPAESPREDPSWAPVAGLIAVVALGALRALPSAPDYQMKPVPVDTRDWTYRQSEPPPHLPLKVPATARPAPRAVHKWDPAEVAGYTFRRLPDVPGSSSLTFRADGTVVRSDAPGGAAERWVIGPDGDVQIIGAFSNVTARLVKLHQMQNLYDIECDGRSYLYARRRP